MGGGEFCNILIFLIKVMIVVGGQAPKAIRSVECYDFEEERWDQVAELPSRRCRAGTSYFTQCESQILDAVHFASCVSLRNHYI